MRSNKAVYVRTGWLRGVVFATLCVTLPITECAHAGSASSVKKIPKIDNVAPGKPVTKLEIIATVTARYKGRIVSIRKKPDQGENCHYVKMIKNDTGEFLTIHVACNG